MNNHQRKIIADMIERLNDVKAVIEELASEEQDKFDNLSDGLQMSENGKKLEEAVAALEEAAEFIDSAISNLETAQE